MMKFRMMRLAGHMAYMGRREMRIELWCGNPKKYLGRLWLI
jgi:hypothetical protein